MFKQNNIVRKMMLCFAVMASVFILTQRSIAQSTPVSFADLAETLSPAVVNISTAQNLKSPQFGNKHQVNLIPLNGSEIFLEEVPMVCRAVLNLWVRGSSLMLKAML